MNRRTFLIQSTAAIGAGAILPGLRAEESKTPASIRFGTCTVGLKQAREAGLEGAQIEVGKAAERLDIDDASVRSRYKDQMRESTLPVCGLIMGLLNSNPLASDPRGPAWLDQSIDAARELDVRVVLVAFFGKGDLLGSDGKIKQDDVDEVVRRLKKAAPRAKEAGVVLAIENFLNGEENARILDRIRHDSVQSYYDVYNTGTTKGHKVRADIKHLQGRIAQFHFKNGPKYLDEEPHKFEAIAAAVKEIHYTGWVVLETSNPSGNPVADARRNGDYLRKLLA